MGRRRAEAIKRHPGARIVKVADADFSRAASLGQNIPCPATGDPEECLRDPGVDIIFVCTPNDSHAALASEALRRGKHVFCEKPLARNPEEARQVLEAASHPGVFLKVGSPLRFFPNVLKAKELVNKGVIGEPLYARGWIGIPGTHLASTWFSESEVSGGGVFLDMGVHLLDLARWFLGEVTEGTGYVGTLHWSVEPSEDIGTGVFRFEGGRLAMIQVSWMEWPGAGYAYFELIGSKGFVRADNRGDACTCVLGLRDGSQETFDFSDRPPRSYDDELAHFISSLMEGKQPMATAYDGLRAVQMAHAVYRASRTGVMVAL